MPGEFLDPVGSIQTFVRVVDQVMRVPELDPKQAFRTATPGVIGDLVEQMGPPVCFLEQPSAIDNGS